MIDARFSAKAFSRLGLDTAAAEELAHDLSGEVMDVVGQAVEQALRRVVEQLRVLGHDMRERERKPRSQRNTHGYTFGHDSPDGWLVVHAQTYTIVVCGGAAPEPVLVNSEEQSSVPPADGEIPF